MPIYGEEDPIKEYNERLAQRFPIHEGYKHIISYEKLLNALQRTKSIKDAATILGINYKTMRKYCKEYIDPDTGKDLFEKYKRPKGRGIRRMKMGAKSISKYPVTVFRKQKSASEIRTRKFKEMLQEGHWIPLECEICRFNNRRLADLRSPLILNFKNGDAKDWRIDNIRYLCYNCYFLFVTDPIPNDTLLRLENEGAIEYDFLTEKPQKNIDTAKQVNEIFNRHLDIIGVHNKTRLSRLDDDIDKNQKREDSAPDDLISYL